MAENTELEKDDGKRVTIDRTYIPKLPSFVDVYANDAYVQMTPWDVRIMFGVLSEVGDNQEKSVPVRVADVRLSLHLAKKVAKILNSQIQTYEKEHGTLSIPG